eukprot:TRINITY_DN20290_c0_g1_i4.p1 TRINITY_DN20290_c0_g1~~TRINITY_DN20290_c0_g1_i4.p1  ORF type:complete len:364 (-),score=43.49 TRINITY_DN20290_c0_g1_i4:33-1124(-)
MPRASRTVYDQSCCSDWGFLVDCVPESTCMAQTRRTVVLLFVSGLAHSSTVLAQSDPLGEPFPATIELSDLDGQIGLLAFGAAGDYAGTSVAPTGDINADGIDDLIIGAPGSFSGRDPAAGRAYVVFGRTGGFPEPIDLVTLDGLHGFRIESGNRSACGQTVAAAGDINGDGIDDFMVAAPYASFGGPTSEEGAVYVIFGRDSSSGETFPAVLDPTTLDGSNGFAVIGTSELRLASSASSRTLAGASDVNGDGFHDIVIGARVASPGFRQFAGRAYVIFGRDAAMEPFPSQLEVDQISLADGFAVNGRESQDQLGTWVSMPGDLTGDGLDDIAQRERRKRREKRKERGKKESKKKRKKIQRRG